MLTCTPCSLNFPNLFYNFFNILISLNFFPYFCYFNTFMHHAMHVLDAPVVIRLDRLPSPANIQRQSAEMYCKSMLKVELYPTPYARIDTFSRSSCSLNFPNLCDTFVRKLVSQIRKCRQLQRVFVL